MTNISQVFLYYPPRKSNVFFFQIVFLHHVQYETSYSRMDQVKFVKDSLLKIWRSMVMEYA